MLFKTSPTIETIKTSSPLFGRIEDYIEITITFLHFRFIHCIHWFTYIQRVYMRTQGISSSHSNTQCENVATYCFGDQYSHAQAKLMGARSRLLRSGEVLWIRFFIVLYGMSLSHRGWIIGTQRPETQCYWGKRSWGKISGSERFGAQSFAAGQRQKTDIYTRRSLHCKLTNVFACKLY
jgi:hypothetical protein